MTSLAPCGCAYSALTGKLMRTCARHTPQIEPRGVIELPPHVLSLMEQASRLWGQVMRDIEGKRSKDQ